MFSIDLASSESIKTYANNHGLQQSEVVEEAVALLLREAREARLSQSPAAGELIEPTSIEQIMKKLDAIKTEVYYVDHNVQVLLTSFDVCLKHYESQHDNIRFTDELSETVNKAEECVRFSRETNVKKKKKRVNTL
jgi:hypothetical protein